MKELFFTLEREEKPGKTCGELKTSGIHLGWTLEDHCRDKNADGVLDEEKVYGETALPYGRYRLIITYSATFKKLMIQIVNVKGGKIMFGTYSVDAAGCRIHGGNDIDDTFGCPLLGASRKANGDVYDCKAVNAKLFSMVDVGCKEGIVYLDIIKKP